MTKTILFVVNDARWFITHRLPIALEAGRRGYGVHVATPPGPFVEQIEAAGLQWHRIDLVRGSINPFRELAVVAALYRLYRRVRPDLVHHVTAKPLLYGTIAARLARVPAIVNAVTGLGHVFVGREPRFLVIRAILGTLYRIVLRHPRLRMIFQNPDDRALFLSRHWARSADAVLIASGVDVSVFQPRVKPHDGEPVVLFPGRLIFTKGVGELVAAADQLRHEGVRARFVLTGNPDAQNPAGVPDAQIEEWRAKKVVELWGERHDMPEVYAQADIVCLPSYREGMPKALIEAAACGLPIVTTDAPGCRDVVRDGDNGLLVPVGKTEPLTAALRTLIGDGELRERMGRRGRERAVAEFSAERVCRDTVGLYDELLGGAK